MLFPAAILFVLGALLLLHHGWTHFYEDEPSHAREESCVWVCYFQLKDILHFESWSMVCLTGSFSMGLICDLRSTGTLSVFAVLLCVLGVLFMLAACLRFETDGRVLGYRFHNICNHETWILVCFFNACLWLFIMT